MIPFLVSLPPLLNIFPPVIYIYPIFFMPPLMVYIYRLDGLSLNFLLFLEIFPRQKDVKSVIFYKILTTV